MIGSDEKEEKRSMEQNIVSDVTQQMISSCFGAVVTSLFVTPLDVVKVRLQTQNAPLKQCKCYLYCSGLMDHICLQQNGNGNGYDRGNPHRIVCYSRSQAFSGTLDAFFKIPKHEGMATLWSGLQVTLVIAIPATMIYFTCYEQCRSILGYRDGMQSGDWWKPMLAGMTARTFTVTVISPLEMVRTKMQSEKQKPKDVLKAASTMVRQSGVLRLWTGLGATLLRDVPFSALYWYGYEDLRSRMQRMYGSKEITFWHNFTAGAISGAVAGVVTMPFDVIKTHRQIELGQAMKTGQKTTTSTFRLIQQLYLQQGIPSLFTGIVPRVVKVAPACAIMISSYEFFKSWFRSRSVTQDYAVR